MRIKRICAFSCALLLWSSLMQAQRIEADTVRVGGEGSKTMAQKPSAQKSKTFSGVAVGFDVCGTVMALATPFGQYEAFARVNLKDKFFPIVEAGLGVSDHEDEDTHLHYKTSSPYFRLGVDYNILKDKTTKNRVLLGARVGLAPYKFDLTGPDQTDPVYLDTYPIDFRGQKSTMVWAEIVAGAEARVWKCLHLGWSVRYKLRLHESKPDIDNAWYVPGYGKTGGHRLGGTFNVIIDI